MWKNKEAQWLCCWCAESVLSLGVCEKRDGWLVAWGMCGCMLIRFSAVWRLPLTILYLQKKHTVIQLSCNQQAITALTHTQPHCTATTATNDAPYPCHVNTATAQPAS